MNTPLVSVIIPAYNGGELLRAAVQSVLDQTYPHFELLVVDDLGPEPAEQALQGLHDPRLRCLRQPANQGAVAARKAGLDASRGEIIAFLDQDDYYHPEKLQVHVDFLQQHPEISVTYNARFELEQGSNAIRSIWQAPDQVTLADLILGFPFSPSDTVLRRQAALQEDIWDQSYVYKEGQERIFNGGEIVFGGRLALSGYQFHSVGRPLNYRRYHSLRTYRHLAERCRAEKTCQDMILNDPRCPEPVRSLRSQAYLNTYLIWAYFAFSQDETANGQSYLAEAVRLDPGILDGRPPRLMEYLVANTASNTSFELSEHMQRILAQFPPALANLADQLEAALAYGYLVKGVEAVFWDRPEEAAPSLMRAGELHARVEERLIHQVAFQLLAYQREFGDLAARQVLGRVASALQPFSERKIEPWLRGNYALNRAFQAYRQGQTARVPLQVVEAISNDRQYLWNKGALSILVRSLLSVRTASQN